MMVRYFCLILLSHPKTKATGTDGLDVGWVLLHTTMLPEESPEPPLPVENVEDPEVRGPQEPDTWATGSVATHVC